MCYHPSEESDPVMVRAGSSFSPGNPDVTGWSSNRFKAVSTDAACMRDPPACLENVPGAVSSFSLTPPQNQIHMLFLLCLIVWHWVLCMEIALWDTGGTPRYTDASLTLKRTLTVVTDVCRLFPFRAQGTVLRLHQHPDGPGSHYIKI